MTSRCRVVVAAGSGPSLCVLLRTKIRLQFNVTCVLCPIRGGPLPENIFRVDSCTPLDEKVDELVMSGQSGLMQGRGMGMEPDRVIAVWIFARIKQRGYDLKVAKLRCQRERTMSIFRGGPLK